MSKEQLSQEEIEEIYKAAMSIADTDDIERIKSVSCKFFRDGKSPRVYSSECKGCLDDDAVRTCQAQYLGKIFDKPQRCWTPDFDKPVKRDNKVKLKDIQNEVGVQCSTCYMADRCPMYQAGAECSIDWGEDKDVSEMANKDIVNHLIEIQFARVKRMGTFEKIDGGMVDMNLSGEMDRLSRLVADRYDLDSFKVKATLEANGNAANSGGGVLAKLFGKSEENKAIEGEEQKSLPNATKLESVPEFEDAEYIELPKEDNAKPKAKTKRARK